MKMGTSRCKIVGVQLGEAAINYIRQNVPPIDAVFALISENGPVGSVSRNMGWSPATMEAMQKFAEAMEADVMATVFDDEPGAGEGEAVDAEKSSEPQQF